MFKFQHLTNKNIENEKNYVLINNVFTEGVHNFLPPVWERVDPPLPEVEGLLFKESLERAFEAIEVSKGLAT